jgi:hypothetical protein
MYSSTRKRIRDIGIQIAAPKTQLPVSKRLRYDTSVSRSALFQVPLSPCQVLQFKNPPSQDATDPQNCAAVSAQLIGIISPTKSDELSAYRLNQGLGDKIARAQMMAYMGQWASHINKLLCRSGPTTPEDMYSTSTSDTISSGFNGINDHLFDGFATIVLVSRQVDNSIESGHFMVVAKTGTELSVIDPQQRTVDTGVQSIQSYLSSLDLNGMIETIQSKRLRSAEEFRRDYNGFVKTVPVIGSRRKRRRTRRSKAARK